MKSPLVPVIFLLLGIGKMCPEVSEWVLHPPSADTAFFEIEFSEAPNAGKVRPELRISKWVLGNSARLSLIAVPVFYRNERCRTNQNLL